MFYIFLSENNVDWPLFFMLYNNFFYIPLSFVFYCQKDFYDVHHNIDAFFLFLLQIDFDTFHKYIDAFCFSFLQNNFDTSQEPLFEASLYILIMFSRHIFIYEKEIFD